MRSDSQNIKSIILDLDQTLTVDQGSWLQFTKLIGADYQIHQSIYNKFKKGELNYSVAKNQLISLWKTASNLDRNGIKEVFRKIELRDGAEESITYLKQKYRLCIISGAIDTFVEVFAEKLGISDWYASTKFIFNASDILEDFQYKLSRGEDKVGFLNDFCSIHSIKPSECAAIGDGESDMPIFEKVGLPILFLASETTEKQKNQVKIHLHNLSEVKEIL